MNRSVLLMGYRPPVAQRLAAREIPFVVWHDKPIKRSIAGCSRVIDGESFLESTPATIETICRLFSRDQQFSHVIAGTEGSVIPASMARRLFCARPTEDLVVRRCRDKRLMKAFLRDQGVPLIPFVDPSQQQLTAKEIVNQLGLPVVVKPANLSGRQGITIVRSSVELEHYLNQADFSPSSQNEESDTPQFGRQKGHLFGAKKIENPILFEKFIDAPEVSVESWIVKKEVQFSNVTEYADKTWVNLVPSRHSNEVHQKLLKLNQQVVDALDIEWGLTHAEYFIADDQIYFGEIAIRPPGGYLMELISLAYQFDAWDSFLANELDLPCSFQPSPKRAAASVLFHPGPGKIAKVEGLPVIESDPNLQVLQLLRRPGQAILPRTRVSNAAAYAIFSAPTPDEALASIESARKTIKFILD